MTRSFWLQGVVAVAIAAMLIPVAPVSAQGQSLGTVRVTRKVVADGQALAAGTYTLRLVAEAAKPVVGQTTEESRWVEFVQGGQVKGREVATVLTTANAKKLLDTAPPAAGESKSELLKGNDYLRVWLNKGGTQYVVHLAVK